MVRNDSSLLDLFYDIRLNTAVAIFQIFATQMLGYGFAGIRKLFFSITRSRTKADRYHTTDRPNFPVLENDWEKLGER